MGKVSYDPNVLSQALSAASQFGATAREKKALIEAGLVETGLRNLSGGDRDSVGFLQQRASQGWTGLTDVPKATAEFLQHARALTRQGFKGSAGQLAQAVQRSAFPARYDERAGDAASLLGGAGGSSAPSVAGSDSSTSNEAPAAAGGIDPAQLVSLLTEQQRPVIQSAGIQAPSFAARPATPAGYAPPQGGGGPAPAPDVSPLLAAIAGSVSTGGPDLSSVAGAPGQASIGGPRASGGGSPGKVTITGPDPGRIAPGTLAFGRKISAVFGEPIVGDSGAGHSHLTVNGNVSEHSTGHAVDYPATGQRLIAMGQAALIAAGMPEAQARKQTGGLFNITSPNGVRHQIIFNTQEGGDHTTHLHASAAKRR